MQSNVYVQDELLRELEQGFAAAAADGASRPEGEAAQDLDVRRADLALPLAIGFGVLGLLALGASRLLGKRGRGAKSSYVADALRTVSLSVLGVVASRVAQRVIEPLQLEAGAER